MTCTLKGDGAVIISDVIIFVCAADANASVQSRHLLRSVSEIGECGVEIDRTFFAHSSLCTVSRTVHIFSDLDAGCFGLIEIHIAADCNNSLTIAHVNVALRAELYVVAFNKYSVSLSSVEQRICISRYTVCQRH